LVWKKKYSKKYACSLLVVKQEWKELLHIRLRFCSTEEL